MNKVKFVFFGSSKFSCIILDELKAAGFLPSLVVAVKDKPKGRKLLITPPDTKVWANANGIPCLQPEKLNDSDFQKRLLEEAADGANLFIVASYGKIIPRAVLDIPKYGTLNVHPSLLPKLRGATPIQSAILTENETGVSIMLLDEEMDHGPILGQEKTDFTGENTGWPPYADILEEMLAKMGGQLLVKTIPGWIEGKIKAVAQNHEAATYTKKITKEDGLIDLADNAEENLKKIRAYAGWPSAYFFSEKNGTKIRVAIKKATIEDGNLKLIRVIPESKKEMPYEDFLRGIK